MSVKSFFENDTRKHPFKNNTPGDKWYNSFLKRHPKLAVRTPEGVTPASGAISEGDIRKWFTDIERYLREKDYFDILLDSSRVFNGDETAFQLCPKDTKVLAGKGSKNVYEIDQGNAKENITVMFTFSASGDITPPLIIFPYVKIPLRIVDTVPQDWGIGHSKKGWMTSEIFYEYISNILYPYLIKQKVKFPIILFVDGHKTHLTYELSTLCSEKKIILIALYPNATRVLQPADVACFKPLKTLWKQGVLRWRRENPLCQLTKINFAPILRDIIPKLKKLTVQNGFKACGLVPWDPNQIDFSKCLGTHRVDLQKHDQPNNEDVHERKLTYDQFISIVGEQTIRELEGATVETGVLSDNEKNEFKHLIKIYEFFNKIDRPHIENPFGCNELANEGNVENPNTQKENLSNIDIMDMPIVFSDYDVVEDENIPDEEIVAYAIATENALLQQNETETPCLRDHLRWPKTPERSGKRQSERIPFVITSSGWKKIYEDKQKEKIDKEKEKEVKKMMRQKKRSENPKGSRKHSTSNILGVGHKKTSKLNEYDSQSCSLKSSNTKTSKRVEEEKKENQEGSGEARNTKATEDTSTENKGIEDKGFEDNHDVMIFKNPTNTKTVMADGNKSENIEFELGSTQIPEHYVRNLFKPKESTIFRENRSADIECELESKRISEHHVRNLFGSKENTTDNIPISVGLCFICVRKICTSRIGIKCQKCKRAFHESCLKRKGLYEKNFVCITCSK